MIKKSLKEMQDKFKGQPVAVLGAGPSLLVDYSKLPKGTILISVNHHAARLVECDYMVFCDNPNNYPDAATAHLDYIGRRLSIIEGFGDFIFDCRKWYEGTSASLATWFACHLGGAPVLLCGMDCYQGDAYFYDRKGYDSSRELVKPLEHQLLPWQNATAACRNSENIRAVSGPLIELFGVYKNEKL